MIKSNHHPSGSQSNNFSDNSLSSSIYCGNDHNGFKVTRDETYPVEQSSIENILPSIWCFIQPPSYEKAPKLMDQSTRNSKSYKEYSNSKLLPSFPQVTINHVLLEPLTASTWTFSHFPVMDLIGQPSEPHSIHCVSTTSAPIKRSLTDTSPCKVDATEFRGS